MQIYARDGRPLPLIAPIAQPHFEAARTQALLMQKCPREGFFFYPRSHCPVCLGSDWRWEEARREGNIYSFTVDRVGQDPSQKLLAPFAIAVVDLVEGPRLVGKMVGCSFDILQVGLPVTVEFQMIDAVPAMCFRPTGTELSE
jgi:uncharacterized OB-fold protein